MKTPIILALMMAVFFGHPIQNAGRNYNTQAPGVNQEQMTMKTTAENAANSAVNSSEMMKKKKKSKKAYTVTDKKVVPYRILSCAPTLNYTVLRIGNGNRIMFSIRGGNITIPRSVTFDHNSGFSYNVDNKKGFDNVNFPFTCTLNSAVSYMTNPFNNWPSKLNDFKIEINQPGIWEISFNR